MALVALLAVGLFSNKWLWGAIGLSVVLQLVVIYVPFLNSAFGTTPLGPWAWVECICLAAVVHADDVGMPKCRRQVGLASEASAILLVGRPLDRQGLQSDLFGQPWMLREVDLTHSTRPLVWHPST